MKKLLFIPIILTTLSICKAQQVPVDSFYTPGSTWTEYNYFDAGQGSGRVSGYTYMLGQDTNIANHTYHLLYVASTGSCNIPSWLGDSIAHPSTSPSDFQFRSIGGLRVDSQKVYAYLFDSANSSYYTNAGLPMHSDFLLYDFKAYQVGDTLKTIYNWQPSSGVVSSIDSVQLSNGYYVNKYTVFSNSNLQEYYWIAGIGSRSGLLNYYTNPTPSSEHTLCYHAPDFSYSFPDSSLPAGLDSNCFAISNTGVVNATPEKFSIYPNPATSNYLYIRATNKENIACISVYDMTGRTRYVSKEPFSNTNNINLYLPLDKGVYFILVQYNDNRSITQKLVKL